MERIRLFERKKSSHRTKTTVSFGNNHLWCFATILSCPLSHSKAFSARAFYTKVANLHVCETNKDFDEQNCQEKNSITKSTSRNKVPVLSKNNDQQIFMFEPSSKFISRSCCVRSSADVHNFLANKLVNRYFDNTQLVIYMHSQSLQFAFQK